MNKKRIIFVFIAGIFFILLTALVIGALRFNNTISADTLSVIELTEVTAVIDGKEQNISLPYSFQNLSPRTPVTITFKFDAKKNDCLYIKSVYAPLKVYSNNSLIYKYGQKSTYPKFMQDPATAVEIVPLPDTEQNIKLRMEYLSPCSRDVLIIHPVLLGSETAIMKSLCIKLGFSFVFSLIELFIGLFLFIASLFVISFEKKGIAFFWLGFFAFATGIWAFDECNLTGLFIHNPTILYLLAFAGLFTLPIPLIYFGLEVINFKNKIPLLLNALLLGIFASLALFFQLFGLVSLSKSMYLFHILIPFTLCFFAGCILYEGIKCQNKSAKRFFFPMLVLALFTILETVNYQLRFTNVLSLFFQIGIMIFILMMCMNGGIFIRDSLHLHVEKQQLEFEVNLMEKQVEAQKKHHKLLRENAEIVKAQRHDLRHQLAVIRNYSENEDNSKLISYLNTLIAEIPLEKGTDYCENTAVNAIVSHYAGIAEQNGIKLSIKLNVPEYPEQITDSNLCVIFGNLLENAVEACARMTEGHKFIRLNSRLQYEILTITMDNSFDGKFVKKDGKFVSRKRRKLGIGLDSITSVTEKHGGSARFEADGLVFKSSVYVKV
ncbi:sensor histidine kinase [Anaerovorax odorimutans]|uniref:sensor histidine kinase n=1 Tax=Anaerovorax odorimutans TaxID=109327 RepID=UPI000421E3DA|nr:sensor histidine kinase [Anaerovorax odorimutans]